MSLAPENAATLGNGDAYVALCNNGESRPGEWETTVLFKAAHLSSSCTVWLEALPDFRRQLRDLDARLSGRAGVATRERNFDLMVEPKGATGHLRISVSLNEGRGSPVEWSLQYAFDSDQSYLRRFIDGLDKHFARAVQ